MPSAKVRAASQTCISWQTGFLFSQSGSDPRAQTGKRHCSPRLRPSRGCAAFFNAAEVFVYVSFYEGFGLPIMEAMACGTPVITSRGTSLEEIAGDGAMLVDPMDEASIAEALTRSWADADLRHRLGQAGLARSRQFSFKNAASQTIGVYGVLWWRVMVDPFSADLWT